MFVEQTHITLQDINKLNVKNHKNLQVRYMDTRFDEQVGVCVCMCVFEHVSECTIWHYDYLHNIKH